MSLFPMYERMVRGSSLDPNDYDYFNRGSLRAPSVMPESFYFRHHDSKGKPGVSRGLSTLRETPVQPEGHLTSLDLTNDIYAKKGLGQNFRDEFNTKEGYWLQRCVNSVKYPGSGVYFSNEGRQYPVYAPRRFMTSYWSYHPHPRYSKLPTTIRVVKNLPQRNYSNCYRPAYVHSPSVRRYLAWPY